MRCTTDLQSPAHTESNDSNELVVEGMGRIITKQQRGREREGRMLDVVPMRPVMTQPMRLVTLKTCVTESGSINLSCTFFCVATTEQVAPRMATLVNPGARVAFKAYSAHSSSKEGEVSVLLMLLCSLSMRLHIPI